MIRTCPLFVCFFFFINLPCILREEGAAYGTRLEVVGVHSLPEHWYYVSAPVYGSLSRSPSPISDVVEYSAARGGHGQIAPARISGKTEKVHMHHKSQLHVLSALVSLLWERGGFTCQTLFPRDCLLANPRWSPRVRRPAGAQCSPSLSGSPTGSILLLQPRVK